MPTLISDIYEPETFAKTIDERAVELNAFYASGVIQEDTLLSSMAAQGGRIGEMPNYGPLAQIEPNISSDDPASFSTPEKVESQSQLWRLAALNQSWSTMNLARDLALADPATAILNKIGQYWATEQEKRVIAASRGILADNIVSNAGDMLVDIYDDIAIPLEANLISPAAVMDAQQTSGDHQFVFTVIAMHSVVYTNLKKQQVISFVAPAATAVPVPFYLGMRVVIDDSLPVTSGTDSPSYLTILYGTGVFGHGVGRVTLPTELEQIPSAGDGAGQEVLYSRTSDIYHPWGLSFLSSSVAADSATLAELVLAANWERIYDRKNVPLAFLQTNG